MKLGLAFANFTWSTDQVIFIMPNVTDLEPFDVLATTIIPALGRSIAIYKANV